MGLNSSHQDVHQTAAADAARIICQSHEDCDARSSRLRSGKLDIDEEKM